MQNECNKKFLIMNNEYYLFNIKIFERISKHFLTEKMWQILDSMNIEVPL